MNIIERIDKWEKFNSKNGVPNTDIERVKAHYTGFTIWGERIYKKRNFVCFFLIPFAYLTSIINKWKENPNKVDAVITSPDKEYLLSTDNIPDELRKKYSTILRLPPKEESRFTEFRNLMLDNYGRKLIRDLICKYPSYTYMVYYVMIHMSYVFKIIKEYNPNAIITTQTEQDYSTSLITNMCEHLDTKYICVQHGEYCYNPSMAYMRFSEYYAWNKETIDAFELCNTKISYAHLYIPEKCKKQYYKKENPRYFITYYLSNYESINDIERIKNLLCTISTYGYKCCIRRHPRSNPDIIKKVFYQTNIDIEDTLTVTVGESISDCIHIVAYRCTIMSEAYANSMDFFVDDIVGDINVLKRVHYINLYRATSLLSSLLNSMNIKYEEILL